MAMVTGGELLVRTLVDAGVKTVFGLHGAHLETIFQACAAHGVALIDTRHEVGAGHAAEGYARAARRLGVALVTAGPGFTNCITSMANACLDRTPVLYVAGSAALRDAETNTLQAGIDQAGIARPLTKWSHTVTVAAQIPRLVAHAIRIATSPPTGPVLLDMPMDVLNAAVDEQAAHRPKNLVVDSRPGPSHEALTTAVQLLAASERPIIMAGAGAWQADCACELREFAELTGIPVFSDFQAHGLLPSDHPLYGGTFHKLDDLAAPGARPDVVLALGVRFGLFTLGASDRLVPAAAKLIHVEVDPKEIGRLRDAAVAIPADCREALRALLVHSRGGPWPDRASWQGLVRGARADRRARLSEALRHAGPRIHPYQAVSSLIENISDDTIIVGDGAEAYHWMNEVVRQRHPGSYITHGFLGAVGMGLGLAIGAQAAHPRRPVLCLVGDGAIGFTIAEFDTLARHELPVVVAVMNNRSWAASQHFQEMVGNPVRGTRLSGARYHDVAVAFGCEGRRISSIEELGPAIRQAFASGRPTCLNIEIDVTPMPPELAMLASRHS
ncbi:MAG TPA: thiamine pyrophosphate-binding protein [Steroidobacteraceae bacterium]|nr:thiamine pyrophosphate-binding protein [Steroidobacteraceae bacterium]